MQINSETLLNDLTKRVEQAMRDVSAFKELSETQLNYKNSPTSWSILECLEHLNLYGDFYLPEIEKRILAQAANTQTPVFKSGVLGNYFANMMSVEHNKIKKIKSPADKNPLNSDLKVTTIDRFLKQQDTLLHLLNQARQVNLTKTKSSISISKWVTIRLGDTFRFLIYHIERHVLQAKNVL